jgi:putative ABC transport system ATP-binding protein
VFRLRDVDKLFKAGGTAFRLHVPTLDVARGDKIALTGESGSGKSTLLELLAMILEPTSCAQFAFAPVPGAAHDVGALWHAAAADALGALRSRHIGYVLQHGGLLPYLSVRENIELSRRLLAMPPADVAEALAERLGIRAQLDKLPDALSVGQRQRAAIARARVTLIIATHAQGLAQRAGLTLVPHRATAADDRVTTVTVEHGR